MKIEEININELKNGDIFSFRTIKRPIWWRYIEVKEGEFTYEEIRSGFRHSSTFKGFVLRRLVN